MNTARNLDKEIAQYLPKLNDMQKRTVLTVVKTFMQEQKDWWDEIGEEQQQAIDKALLDVKEGRLRTHDDVMKKYKRWLKK
ncbi:hypothetical protein QEG73_13145 [Chitinophagaceae bacterium 26-R-25]|nr:hypothetical protein [Chitinophagaceae bacterium 26-R-25]